VRAAAPAVHAAPTRHPTSQPTYHDDGGNDGGEHHDGGGGHDD
jgi:hypothetical protein